MESVPTDFLELIELLTSHGVDFILVGAYALAFHGKPRFTEDIDFWVKRSIENANKIQAALAEFGIPISDEAKEQLTQDRKILQFGLKPLRVDILTFLDGCEYEAAKSQVEMRNLGSTQVQILSLGDYVRTKRAAGRPKDLSDLELLKEQLGASVFELL